MSTGVRLTPKIAAPCGPDYLERHATSLSDLDGDGTLDRVAITREPDALVVRLHEMPSMREKASWKLLPANGYVEVATPQRRGSTRGDLWITMGQETLYHLENGKLVPITTGYRDVLVRIDVDGDGRVDPIGSSNSRVRALVAGNKWLDLPVLSSSRIHGAPVANQQQEATDLDGNGARELVIERDDAFASIEVPAMREVWSVKGKPSHPQLVRWGSELVIAITLDEKLRIYSAKHALIGELPDAESYSRIAMTVGSQLFVTGHPWHVYDRANPTTSVAALDDLVGRLDDAAAPFGPVRLAAADAPGLLAVAQGSSKELVLVDPKTRAARRSVWKSDRELSRIEHDINPSLVDLDRDGASELLLEEVTRTRFHHGASWNTSQLRIVDGSAKLLWQEPNQRREHWVHEGGTIRGKRRQTEVDGTHVRAFDLGDGTMPLRVRSVRDEYYVLTTASKIRAIPACLE